MNKYWKVMLAGALVVCAALFGSCAHTEQTGSGVTDITIPSIDDPTPTPSPTPTPTPAPTPIPKIDHTGHAAVTEYSAVNDMSEGLSGVARLPDGNLIVLSCSDYVDHKVVNGSDRHVTLNLIDTAEDKIIKSVDTGYTDIVVLGVTEDGRILLHNENTMQTFVYSKELELINTLEKTGIDCFYDPYRECLVYYLRGSICRRSLDGTEERAGGRMFACRLCSFDPVNDSCVISDYDAVVDSLETYYVSPLDGGDPVAMCSNNSFYSVRNCGRYVLFSVTDKKDVKLMVRDQKTGKLVNTFKLPENAFVYSESFCDRFLFAVPEISANSLDFVFYVADPVTGRCCHTGVSVKESYAFQVFTDSRTGDYLIGDTVAEDDVKARLYQICPEAFELTDQLVVSSYTEYERSDDVYKTSARFSTLQDKADRIAARYGINIILGDETKNHPLDQHYEIVSVEDSDRSFDEISANIDSTLDQIDLALSVYPAGFCDVFRDYHGGGGLTLALVDKLHNPNGEFLPEAITLMSGSTSYIVLDVNWVTRTTIDHEMWHAVENIVEIMEPGAFDAEKWDINNPEGFSYIGDFDNYLVDSYVQNCRESYTSGDKDNVYFTKLYGTVNAREDRATLVESIMGNDVPFDSPFKTALEDLNSYPHIKAKLDYMAQVLKDVLGGCYWE